MGGMRLLVTGFEPFGSDHFNASGQVLALLPSRVGQHTLATALLPVSFARSGPALQHLVAEHRPQALICLGEAGGRSRITPERWGVNEDDARIPDNDGAQPRSRPITAGPPRVASTLDPELLTAALNAAGFGARVSQDAGRFVCNHVAYLAYRMPLPALFIHVPALRPAGQTATVGAETDAGTGNNHAAGPRDLNELARALEVALGTL